MEKYYKNFILSGEIDNYCVLCQESLDDDADVERHMRWEKHRKDLKLQEYLHKFKKDFIYKINDTYYCQICNLITTDVAGHIKESSHQDQKTNPQRISKKSSLVKRDGSSIIVNDKAVTRQQWHGIRDGKCSLCGIDSISKVNIHILSASHMSNLTQSSIKCEAGNCYRELKYDKFCCFTCFETIDNIHLTNHWTEKHSEKSDTRKAPENNNKTDEDESNDSNNNIMVKILAKSRSKYYKIDVEKKTSKCLLCDASVKPTVKELDKHTSEFHPETEEMNFRIIDSGKRRHELAEYASKNYIKLNEGGSKCFCELCDVFMSAHMNCAKQHVEGSLHRGYLELKGLIKDTKHEKPPVKPVAYKTFLKDTYGPFNIAEYDVMVFNEGICVEVLSFGLIRVMDVFRGRRGKCYGCDKTLNFIELLKHSKEKEHKNLVLKCKVLAIEEEDYTELIREIRPGLYHCGSCNKVFPFWENMAKHLRSFTHKVQRAKKSLLSAIAAQLLLNPLLDLDDIDEYNKLRGLDGIN